jgi:hypothetical protein
VSAENNLWDMPPSLAMQHYETEAPLSPAHQHYDPEDHILGDMADLALETVGQIVCDAESSAPNQLGLPLRQHEDDDMFATAEDTVVVYESAILQQLQQFVRQQTPASHGNSPQHRDAPQHHQYEAAFAGGSHHSSPQPRVPCSNDSTRLVTEQWSTKPADVTA